MYLLLGLCTQTTPDLSLRQLLRSHRCASHLVSPHPLQFHVAHTPPFLGRNEILSLGAKLKSLGLMGLYYQGSPKFIELGRKRGSLFLPILGEWGRGSLRTRIDQTHKTLTLLKILYIGDSQLWYVSETISKLIKNADAWTHPTESESTPASPFFKQIIQVIHMCITVYIMYKYYLITVYMVNYCFLIY